MSSQRPIKKVKVPKVVLDKTYGPHPATDGKYKSSDSFVKLYRAYQWTQGYDIRVEKEIPNSTTTLACATKPNCVFSITGLFCHFPELGADGYRISGKETTDSEPFSPKHDHAAPYEPMDIENENRRRSLLPPNDPSFENPPLMPVQPSRGFASGSESPAPDVDMRDAANNLARGGGGEGSSQAGSRRSASIVSHVKPERQNTGPPASQASTYTNHQAPPSYRASPVAPAPAPIIAQPPPQRPELLTSFLLDISRSFGPHLHLFPQNSTPLTTNPTEFLELDSYPSEPQNGTNDVFELFKDIRGLPIAQIALGTDGVRKAKKRQVENPGVGVDGRIMIGLQKKKIEAWTMRRIREGDQEGQMRDSMTGVERARL